MYAKLIDGDLVIAPRKMKTTINGERYNVYNPPAEMLEADGWLPVVETAKPDAPVGYDYVPVYTEDAGQIVQSWVLVEAELSPEQALEIILGGESDEAE